MKIGIPKEIKNGEFRVALTPSRVAELIHDGHHVVVQVSAGEGSGFTDQSYFDAGAELVTDTTEVWDVDLVVKVKEPLPREYQYLRPELGLFTFLHLAGEPDLAKELLDKGVRAIAYETVSLSNGSLPLLAPMSQIAGRVGMLFAAHFMQKNCMGSLIGNGKILGGIDGVTSANVVILGGGNVGQHAAHVAIGLAADVVIFDQNEQCLEHLKRLFQSNVKIKKFSSKALQQTLPTCDILIGAVLVQGEHAPELLTREMIAMMPKGSVFVDVAIDQGGMSETSRNTSYDQPTYEEEGVIHCCLPNLPASVAQSSTEALGFATLPYVKELASKGLEAAIIQNQALAMGVNTWDGELRHEGVIKALAV